jgi:fatty acid desaturase
MTNSLPVRILLLLAMSVWLGGFVFYGGVVVPVLHDEFGTLDGAAVTRRVTFTLNLIGAGTLALWLVGLRLRDLGAHPRIAVAIILAWLLSTLSLQGLIGLHDTMERRLDAGRMSGFYPLHRVYLTLSTAQAVANLVLLSARLALWRHLDRETPPAP